MNISKNTVAFLNTCGFVAPFDFKTMDAKVLTSHAQWVNQPLSVRSELARLLAGAKGVVAPTTEAKANKVAEEATLGKKFAKIYRGSQESGGFAVRGDAGGKTDKRVYQPQVYIRLIPAPTGCVIEPDAFDTARPVYACEEAWDKELIKNTLVGLTLVGDKVTTDAKVFVDSLQVDMGLGITCSLLEYLQTEVLPHLDHCVVMMLKQNSKGYIKLVCEHYTAKETPFRA